MALFRALSILAFGLALMPDHHAHAAPALPKALLDAIALNPTSFQREATTLILGYGGPDGLTAAGIETDIAITRAKKRADVTAVLLAADLDADGAVTVEEVEALAPTLGARARATLRAGFAAADPAGTGRIEAQAIPRLAADQALRAFPESRADALRGLIGFDADGNGLLTVAELAKGMASLTAPAQSSATKAVPRPAPAHI